VLATLLMLRRFVQTLRHAAREEGFVGVLGTAALLVLVATVAYAVGQGWSVIDALYFAVATLTTTSVADPDLVLRDGWVKISTVIYQLLGIGVFVEILRRLALSFIAVRTQHRAGGGPDDDGPARQPESRAAAPE
jgi:hypothetical protein